LHGQEGAAEQGAEALDNVLVAERAAGVFALTHGYGQFGLIAIQQVLPSRAAPARDSLGQPVAGGYRIAAPGDVGRGARPRPVLGPVDQASLDGISLDVPRRVIWCGRPGTTILAILGMLKLQPIQPPTSIIE